MRFPLIQRCIFTVFLFAAAGDMFGAGRKLEVTDPDAAREIVKAGGRLIADYGSFSLYEMDVVPATVSRVQVREEYNRVFLNAGPIDTAAPRTPAPRRATPAKAGKRMHLVQFAGPPLPDWREAVVATGVRIVSYIPQNAYLVYGDAASIAKLKALAAGNPHIQWDGDYLDDYKIHPRAGGKSAETSGLYAIQLIEDPGTNKATLALIRRLSTGPVRKQSRVLHYVNLVVELKAADIASVAARPDVVSIRPYVTPKKRDERQDQIIAGNLTGNLPSGPGYLSWLTSKGFTQAQFDASSFAVDITDSGVDDGTTSPNHFGLYVGGSFGASSRVIYNRLEGSPHGGSTIMGCDGHGNINAHIIAGYNNEPSGFPHTDSAGFRYGLGVCPFVRVGSSVIFDPDSYTSPDFADLLSRAYDDGARISSNSWGASVNGDYNIDCQEYDVLVRDAQPTGSAVPSPGNQEMVVVFAAGNDGSGSQTVGSPGTAKNVITVGAAENVHSHSTANGGNSTAGNDGCNKPDTQANNANDMAIFSSRGPCTDLRKKPEIVAPGTHVTGGVAQDASQPLPSTTGNDLACFDGSGVCALPGGGSVGSPNNFFPLGQQFYTTSSGTSHSTPAVAGGCALLRQYFLNNAMSAPSPAMTKAVMMNSARYMSGTGANDSLWSNAQGMGEMDLGFAFDGVARIQRDQVAADKFTASGQSRQFIGAVDDPSKPFRVTIAWTDAPGSTTGDAFNNDLDLTVTADGETYKGNVFNGAHSETGGSADFRDNAESVFLPAGVTGNILVTVTATNINSDGVPNDSDPIDQDFALVVYNATETPAPVLAAAGSAITFEGCGPANGVLDPDEVVTVSFSIQNVGTLDAENVVATLQTDGGVILPDPPKSYGTIVAGGSAVSQSFTFTASGACGGVVTASLQLQSGATDLGTVGFTFPLGVTTVTPHSNTAPISLPGSGSEGVASPYPSNITISGASVPANKVTITLMDINHTYPDDIDILLVGPAGQKVMLMSDVGGGADLNNVTITLDDDAEMFLPNDGLIVSGSYKPTDIGAESLPSPAPPGPYGLLLSVFAGLSPNGTWALYADDDAKKDGGDISGGWSVNVVTIDCCVPAPDLSVSVTDTPDPVVGTQNLTYVVTVSNDGPDAASGVTLTDTLPAGVSFVSAQPAPASQVGDVLTFNLGNLISGAESEVTIVVSVPASPAGTIQNVASISAIQSDPVAANDSASTDTTVLDAYADDDGDGQDNVSEAEAGTDPQNPLDVLRVESVELVGGVAKVRFNTLAGKTYRVEKSDNLGTWTLLEANIAGTGGEVEIDDPAATTLDRRFYRVVIP